MCSKCEAVDDLSADCEQCGKHTHAVWQDPVGEFTDYLRLSRPFAEIYVISIYSRWYDAQISCASFGIEMVASIDNGRYQNS